MSNMSFDQITTPSTEKYEVRFKSQDGIVFRFYQESKAALSVHIRRGDMSFLVALDAEEMKGFVKVFQRFIETGCIVEKKE